MIEGMCIQCGKPAYQLRDKSFKLCASCGWEALTKLVAFIDDSPITDREKVDKVLGLSVILPMVERIER